MTEGKLYNNNVLKTTDDNVVKMTPFHTDLQKRLKTLYYACHFVKKYYATID